MNPHPTPILFLSGAGLPAWIWDGVRANLPDGSIVAAYPKQPGAHLGDYAAAVLEQAPAGSFTLVAHSIGGVVASRIVAAAPERVAGLLGVAATFPAAGTSFLATLPAPQRVVIGLIMRLAGTRPPEKAIRSALCAGIDEADATRIVAEFAPESRHLYRDVVSARTFPAHRGFVVTTADRQVSPAMQYRHADELGAGFRRELSTGHLPMLQDPAALAGIIAEFTAAG
ncbi:alpha/beta fold hydrolase [Nocardia sp. BMG111209]|uniref:alpha/beta fold hydrolase n=1 Tax=Nocardia sp. BMG111209 TaxID=1160137 RepID=UPI00037B5684|nr:alpha/beta hydrolase [Nocardia sp. BMG111209]